MVWNELSRWEKILFVTILVIALFSRFYILGARVMSHDESLHTKYAWQLYAGEGYTHNPMMHGPFLFHATALAYFILGVSDFAARVFPALLGVALVMTPWLFRRWLGRAGAIAGSIMLLISPSISYYSRYIRHDVFNMLAAVLLIWTIFKYLEEGRGRWFYALAGVFAWMYTTKETSYIYTAIFGVILFVPFLWRVLTLRWVRPELYRYFVGALALLIILGAVVGLAFAGAEVEEQPIDEAGNTRMASSQIPIWGRIALALTLLVLIASVALVYFGMGEALLRSMRLFDLLMVVGTLTLPLGSAFIIRLAGVDIVAFGNAFMTANLSNLPTLHLVVSVVIIVIVLVASVLLGLWWDSKRWPVLAVIHYVIFFVFYTTIFTNALGFLSGPLGSLAYWMAQQGVERGTQPWYYYLIVAPLYEYLPLLLASVAGVGAIVHLFRHLFAPKPEALSEEVEEATEAEREARLAARNTRFIDLFFPLFLVGWYLLSWVAYTYAGEKMPWLTVHIALPSIFLAAWGVGRIARGIDWRRAGRKWGWLLIVFLPLTAVGLTVFLTSMAQLIPSLQAGISPAGFSLAQLTLMGRIFGGLVGTLVFGALLVWSIRRLAPGAGDQALRLGFLALTLLLALITMRTASRLNFVNYDLATEHIVYAHGAPDVKVALEQVRDVSWRTTGAAYDVQVAYSEDGSWPFAWYMVDYPNSYFYGSAPDPTRLLESPVIIAGSEQYGAVDAIVEDNYQYFSYKYLWWPIEDYKRLTGERLGRVLREPAMRRALWDIFWNRDYRNYAEARAHVTPLAARVGTVITDPSLLTAIENNNWGYSVERFGADWEEKITLQEWPYRKEFRLYVRRDLASEIWGYRMGEAGVEEGNAEVTPPPDPYANADADLPIAASISLANASPRGLAVSEGSLYLADTTNHSLWHVSPQGAVLGSWGERGTGAGQFQEPWDVAVDDAGNVYVTDTWNHRVQKFSPQGDYLLSWGTFGQFQMGDPNGLGAFYGPRGIAVGPAGNIYVTDTGNKRVQVFDENGAFLREFGGSGRDPGRLDEPVGIAVSDEGLVFVIDTWNRRIQVFTSEGAPLRQWSVSVWDSLDPEAKPYLALDGENNVYVTDPASHRVLVFDENGAFLRTVGSLTPEGGGLVYPAGVAVSADGQLYISDAHTGRAVGFTLSR